MSCYNFLSCYTISIACMYKLPVGKLLQKPILLPKLDHVELEIENSATKTWLAHTRLSTWVWRCLKTVGVLGADEFGSVLKCPEKAKQWNMSGYIIHSVLYASAKAVVGIGNYSLYPDQSRTLNYNLPHGNPICCTDISWSSVGSTRMKVIVTGVWMIPIPWSSMQLLDKQKVSVLYTPHVPTDFGLWYASWGRTETYCEEQTPAGVRVEEKFHPRNRWFSNWNENKDNSFLLEST